MYRRGLGPPGLHMLERRVEVRCNTRRCKNNWVDEFTYCDEERTHRCTRCPYWCCADISCDGAAWDDSEGAVYAWNEEAGLTRSHELYPERTEGMGYSSVYNNARVPWGITDGWGITKGGDGLEGRYWRAYEGYGELFDASQRQTGGSRGMRQWRSDWGGQ